MVGYTSFIKKAKLSDDEVLVTQWNKLLQGNEILEEEKFTSATKAREYLKLNGAKEEEFTPKADGYHFYWNKDDNRIYLIKDDDPNTAVFPENSSVKNAINPFDKNYLTFTAEDLDETSNEATIKPTFLSGDWAYSLNGKDWTEVKADTDEYNNTTIVLTSVGGKVMLRGSNCITSNDDDPYFFTMIGSIAASGSVTSLTDGVGIDPNVTLSDGCYNSMFCGCESLTTAPELPATTLANGCYQSMFEGCTSLITAPELPATTLANDCYYYMFDSCTALTTAPSLPVMELKVGCYSWMFNGCSSLTTAPALPATTLAESCYSSMFNGCSALKISTTSGNKIFTCPSGDLPDDAVTDMFTDCASGEGLFTGAPTAIDSKPTAYYWN